MPLVSIRGKPAIISSGGLGLWMKAVDSPGIEKVWLVVTRECLTGLNVAPPPQGLSGNTKLFKLHRALIEGAASAKFDRIGVSKADGQQNGCPILTLFARDMPKV
jgi:hypothetical protein